MPPPAETVTFAYDGVDTVTATVENATPGTTYLLATSPFGGSDFETAVGPTLMLSVLAGGSDPGDKFEAHVVNDTLHPSDYDYIAWTLYERGTVAEFPFPAEWDYDGDKTVSVTVPNSDALVNYALEVSDETLGSTDSAAAPGNGGDLLLSVVLPDVPTSDYFRASLGDDTFDSGGFLSVRLFSPAVAGEGFPGNPTDAPTPSFPAYPLDKPIWKWVIADLRTSRALTWITTIATDITTSRLLAASWPASLTVPSDDPRVRTVYQQFEEHPEWDEPFVARSSRVLLGFRDTGIDPLWEIAYTGIPFQVVDDVTDGVPRTRLNCWDGRKYLEFLPLVDADGELPGEDGLTFTAMPANEIARAALENWITNNPGCLAETLFDLTSGADETTTSYTLTFGRGTTIADVWTQLEQTGALDITLDPVRDPRARPGCIAVVNFEVEHGQARPAAIFSWDRSPRSLPQISRTEDGLKLANTIQDYTEDVEPATAATDPDSVERFGEYWAMRAWTGQTDPDGVAAFAAAELFFRTAGQTTVTATPSTPRALQPIQEYDVGDRVPVYASERLRKPIADPMRIYGIPFTIDENSAETITGLILSADAVA